MFRMVYMGIFNISSEFEIHILSYKQDIEFDILCKQNPSLVLCTYVLYWYKFQSNVAFSVENIIYEYIEAVYLLYHESFCQKIVFSCNT